MPLASAILIKAATSVLNTGHSCAELPQFLRGRDYDHFVYLPRSLHATFVFIVVVLLNVILSISFEK